MAQLYAQCSNVLIEVPLVHVTSFLLDIHNLPRWNGFFLAVKPDIGGCYRVQTQMGEAYARVRESVCGVRHTVDFHSYLCLTCELKMMAIQLLPEQDSTQVNFTQAVPQSWESDQIQQHILTMDGEIQTLKTLVEAQYTGS